jgi:rhodanese-related sulfurtransferase
MLAKHEAVVIDVRTEPAYQLSHIQGAKLIPFPEIANRIGELPHDKLVVTYCS